MPTAVTVLALVTWARKDTMTRPDDVQSIYDALPVEDKDLHWIEGATRRFDGYYYFGEHPGVPGGWFGRRLN